MKKKKRTPLDDLGITVEANPEDYKWLAVTIGGVFFLMFMIFGIKQDPIATLTFLTLLLFMAPLLYWMRNRHELSKEKLRSQLDQPEAPRMKRLEERMENLETLICRLDSELNYQIEKSLVSRSVSSTDLESVSKMPTSMMKLGEALEGRFQILQELGRGGMGVVFQAYDKQLKEQVAIKLLSPMLSHDPEALERLNREVSAARRITHPNVIRIHDIGEAGGVHYVSMEYFPGQSLKEHVRQSGPLSVMEACQIVMQICDGLAAAHLQGVIHRDLKSQNIIINRSGQIKIIDFGLARTAHLAGLTATGLIMGTPEYMSPEQVAGKRVDERADIYSLGIILYELFTGRVPFSGDSAIAVGFQQIKDDPVPPCEINGSVSPAVEQIILKALQKEPAKRYSGVKELREDLEKAIGKPSGQTGTRLEKKAETLEVE